MIAVILGTVGSSFTSDIAIDDVIVKDGACGTPTDCNFETDLCQWTNVQNADDFDWLRGQGATKSRFTGPSVDHTIGTDRGISCINNTKSVVESLLLSYMLTGTATLKAGVV